MSTWPCWSMRSRSLHPTRSVSVLVEGAWVPGWLLAWQPGPASEPGRWRGLVRFTVRPGFQYEHWRPGSDLRPE